MRGYILKLINIIPVSYTHLPECFPIGQSLNRSDYVIVCGDFGYWHDTDIERNNLDWLENQPWTTLLDVYKRQILYQVSP